MSLLPARLHWRLSLGMALGVLATVAMALAAGYLQLRERILADAGQDQLEQQRIIAAGLDEMFAAVERRTAELAEQLRDARLTPEQVVSLLRTRVRHNPETASAGVLLAEGNPISAERFAVSVTYGNRGLTVVDMVAIGYDYESKPWYRKTLESREGWWADPYFNDYAGGQDTATFDFPLRRADGRPFGMASMSVTLDHVATVAASLGLVQSPAGSRHVLADANGRLLMIWDPAFERAYDLERAARRSGSASLSWLARASADMPAQIVRVIDPEHGPERLAFTPLPRLGWRLGTVVPERALLAPLHDGIAKAAFWIGVILLLLLPLLYALTRRGLHPLDAIATLLEKLGRGEPAPLPAGPMPANELGRLQQAARLLHERIDRHARQLDVAAGEQALARSRWQLASRTQRELLPPDRIFFGARYQCEASGAIRSSEGLASCVYGFSATAPGICSFYVACTSTTGMAGALLLARLAGMIEGLARQSGEPDALLRRLAEQWQGDGRHGRAPQVLAGRLHLDTGHLALAGAQHPPPLLLLRGGAAQSPSGYEAGAPIDAGASGDWPLWQGLLGNQERLLLCSQELLDRPDRHGHRFGERALLLALSQGSGLPPPAMTELVLERAQSASDQPCTGLAAVTLALRERD